MCECRCFWSLELVVGSPAVRVTGGFKLPNVGCGCWELDSGFLQEQ